MAATLPLVARCWTGLLLLLLSLLLRLDTAGGATWRSKRSAGMRRPDPPEASGGTHDNCQDLPPRGRAAGSPLLPSAVAPGPRMRNGSFVLFFGQPRTGASAGRQRAPSGSTLAVP